MTTILLVVIYMAFISLGLPDSILGSAWPSMYGELQVAVSYAGIISMIISAGTIVSSLFSNRLIHKLGTGMVTAISVAMTAVALLGFSFSGSFWQLCLWGIPYGLGAGSVDAALNAYVALNYKSRHMSWLHCFWGVGATLGPFMMGLCLTNGFRWNSGYQIIGVVQVVLVIGLILSLPLWKKKGESDEEATVHKSLSLKETVKLPGAKPILIAFFCYCSLEATAGLWASSYMVLHKGIDPKTAAKWASLFYLGITLGRLVSGFITERVGNKNMVRLGQILALIGTIILIAPLGEGVVLVGLMFVGLGCAPIYPSLLHETPRNFGADQSQAIMGMQMASAYIGTTLMAPFFGILAANISITLYPMYILVFIILMIIMVERVTTTIKKVEHGN